MRTRAKMPGCPPPETSLGAIVNMDSWNIGPNPFGSVDVYQLGGVPSTGGPDALMTVSVGVGLP
jgi:hypothetical protein